jgi:hypothetical protein
MPLPEEIRAGPLRMAASHKWNCRTYQFPEQRGSISLRGQGVILVNLGNFLPRPERVSGQVRIDSESGGVI